MRRISVWLKGIANIIRFSVNTIMCYYLNWGRNDWRTFSFSRKLLFVIALLFFAFQIQSCNGFRWKYFSEKRQAAAKKKKTNCVNKNIRWCRILCNRLLSTRMPCTIFNMKQFIKKLWSLFRCHLMWCALVLMSSLHIENCSAKSFNKLKPENIQIFTLIRLLLFHSSFIS